MKRGVVHVVWRSKVGTASERIVVATKSRTKNGISTADATHLLPPQEIARPLRRSAGAITIAII